MTGPEIIIENVELPKRATRSLAHQVLDIIEVQLPNAQSFDEEHRLLYELRQAAQSLAYEALGR